MSDDSRRWEDDDDDELELEPVDPEVLAQERQRAEERTETALSKINVDELVRESEERELDLDLSGLKNFRFTTRHLLILTAMLSLVLTLATLVGSCNAMFMLGVAALGAGWIWTLMAERARDQQRERKKRELLSAGVGSATAAAGEGAFDEMEEPEAAVRPAFEFRFSMKQLLGAFTVAAIIFFTLRILPPKQLSLLLGMVALVGLAIHIAGFDPPRIVVLGWWLLLALYLLMGLIAAVWPEPANARREPAEVHYYCLATSGSFDTSPPCDDGFGRYVTQLPVQYSPEV